MSSQKDDAASTYSPSSFSSLKGDKPSKTSSAIKTVGQWAKKVAKEFDNPPEAYEKEFRERQSAGAAFSSSTGGPFNNAHPPRM